MKYRLVGNIIFCFILLIGKLKDKFFTIKNGLALPTFYKI